MKDRKNRRRKLPALFLKIIEVIELFVIFKLKNMAKREKALWECVIRPGT